MNRQKLTELVTQPERISSRDSAMLTEMAAQYPYATAIQILLAKSKQEQPDARFFLATAALYTPNRQILKQLMENHLPALASTKQQAKESEPERKAIIIPVADTDTEANQTVPTTPVDETNTSDTTPKPDTDVFEELQKNLKRLREERSKMYTHQEVQQTSDTKKGDTVQDETETTETDVHSHDSRSGMHPALQQIVDEHQQQPLENPRVQEQRNLIDSFLENALGLQKRQLQTTASETQITDLTQNLAFTPQDMATETLAKIMERQGKTDKAIDIYQKLILKYPQKSVYFADCIERLKKNL